MKKALGLFIGRKEVIACTVQDKSFKVLKVAVEPIQDQSPEDLQKAKAEKKLKKIQTESSPLSKAIARAIKKTGASDARIAISFSPSYLITRFFEMPVVPPAEQQNAVRFEGSRYIPYKVEETVSDFKTRIKNVPGEQAKTSMEITYTAVRTDIIRSYLNQVREVSSKIDAVEPVFASLVRALTIHNQKNTTTEPFGLVFFDDLNETNITLISGGMVYISHDFILTEEDPEMNQAHFYQEFKSSLEYFYRQSGERQISKIYLAGFGNLEEWRDFLSRIFKQGIQFEIASFESKNPEAEERKGLLAVSYGLALRALKQKSPVGDFLLIPPAERKSDFENYKQWIGIEFIIIAVIFAVFRLGFFEVYYNQKLQEANRPNPAMAKYATQMALTLDAVSKQRDSLSNELQVIRKFTKERIMLSEKFKMFFKMKPAPIWLDSINYAGGYADKRAKVGTAKAIFQNRLTIQGACFMGNSEKEVQAVNSWVKKLDADKNFMQGFKKITVAEMRKNRFLNQDVTAYEIQVE